MIYHVLSNIKHNGEEFKKGSFIEGALGEYTGLVEAGALAIVEGADTIEEAKEIVGKPAETPTATEAPKVEEQNTWGPRPDNALENQPLSEEEKDKAPEEQKTDAPTLVKYVVLKEFTVSDETSKNFGKHEVGSTIEADPEAAGTLVLDGYLEVAVENTNAPTGDNL